MSEENHETEGQEVAETSEVKTFTQDEVNGIVTKESKKAMEKALKDLGVEDFKTAKEGLEKFKELRDSQKTEAEKAIERAKELESSLSEKDNTINGYKTQLDLLKSGVPTDKLDRYTKLLKTYDGESVEDNIKALLEEFPIVAETATPPNIGGKTSGKDSGSTKDEQMAIIRKNMGL